MPTLPYLTDTSTQLTGTYSASTAALDNYITSNYVSNVSNILIANINTKQPTLTPATSLLGNGSAITNISYGNITGKPTYFQTDWNSTITNKPNVFPADMTDIYNKTAVDTLITNTSKWSIDYLRNNFNNRVIFFLVFVVLIDFSNENIVYFVVRVFLYES